MLQTPLPEGIPKWLEGALYLLGLVAAGGAAWKGWLSKLKISEAPNAIVAGDIMSTKPMKDLVVSVDKLTTAVESQKDEASVNNGRVIDAINRLHDAERSTESAIRDLCREIQRSSSAPRQ